MGIFHHVDHRAKRVDTNASKADPGGEEEETAERVRARETRHVVGSDASWGQKYATAAKGL